jgi:hypothetical protein
MPKMPSPKKLPTPGHYRPPTVKVPGGSWYNAPTRGRKGKTLPSPKKPGRRT